MVDLGADSAARPQRRSDAEEFFQQLRDAAEAVEIDAFPRRSDGGPLASEPGAQGRGAQGFRVEDVHEPERLQALSAEWVLPSGRYAGHEDRGLLERQDLFDGGESTQYDDVSGETVPGLH